MHKKFLLFLLLISFYNLRAQTPKTYSSADILQQLKKLPVLQSVLYIAAHPDDENTRLLGYLANEKNYRTGYLSLTRGDGGQNLIGDEQGIDLGLIRTQELLAARRIDGAEQFFSRAYDFGFSKSPDEALRIWGHDKILSDVVWVIRWFRPDVMIARFPTTGEGGHGHHTASGILAGEAFDAAADPKRFPEQLKYVQVWQAKRLLWNTFNFGGNNTTRDDQFKLDCGGFNPVLGKSYGEIAAESRSQHKSQGFGVAAQRGNSYEFFATIKGTAPKTDLMDDVAENWKAAGMENAPAKMRQLISAYDAEEPAKSLPALVELYAAMQKLPQSTILRTKLKDLQLLVEACSGVFLEATSATQLLAKGDSTRLQFTLNNRNGIDISSASVTIDKQAYQLKLDSKNVNTVLPVSYFVPFSAMSSQPYWLEKKMGSGGFVVDDQQLIGYAQTQPFNVSFNLSILASNFTITKPLMYKFTDPVKAEVYEPVQIIDPVFVNSSPSLILLQNESTEKKMLNYQLQTNLPLNEKVKFVTTMGNKQVVVFDSIADLKQSSTRLVELQLDPTLFTNNSTTLIAGDFSAPSLPEHQEWALNKISYDHIPDVFYHYKDQTKVVKLDLKTAGTRAGYIAGAGDKIPEALVQMGYTVTLLNETDLTTQNLAQFDVIVTGVRAYNIHDWLSSSYDVLMDYVKKGGVLFVQYNTNNSIGPVKAKMSPYAFNISRNRITDETAKVSFLLPQHPALNFPNKITDKDFEGWIQERSTYHAEATDSHFEKILSMRDPGENEQDGSLIVAGYGKGRFVYSGLVFFRELPAGVPGAFRLFANLIANKP